MILGSIYENKQGAGDQRIQFTMVDGKEMFPVVNEEGDIIGTASRDECHSGSKLLHPVVHLHILDDNGRLYLQKRALSKDIQPGKWDTSVGGHISPGEFVGEALLREAKEELGIVDFVPVFIDKYVFESIIEKELVHIFKTVYDGTIIPDNNELEDGRFFTRDEIEKMIIKKQTTPNFVGEFHKYKDRLCNG